MRLYINPYQDKWDTISRRSLPDDSDISERVGSIISQVREDGDNALIRLAREIDGVELSRLELTEAEIEEACSKVDGTLVQAISSAVGNIKAFHEAQLPKTVEIETAPGVKCIQRPVPISRVGLYIPGGRAPLFSTVLMLGIPAVVAGCKDVILCTPPSKDGIKPEIIYAATVCGIRRIFAAGGAQAVAAMAVGTRSIPRRDKIFGPGNRYVTKAKQLLSVSDVAIDMPAGPSEVMVMADSTANPAFVASDLLSQAEHGPDSQAILLCKSESFAASVREEIDRQKQVLPRREIMERSLENSCMIVFDDDSSMIGFANCYAPEHLIIAMEDPYAIAENVTSAGSVFLGNYSPESAGDYASGTNHTLPTSGWARSFSGVNIDSFMRKMTLQEITREGLESLSGTITAMAEAEGLQAHANAVYIRVKNN